MTPNGSEVLERAIRRAEGCKASLGNEDVIIGRVEYLALIREVERMGYEIMCYQAGDGYKHGRLAGLARSEP